MRESVSAGTYTLAEYSYTNDRNRYLSALDYGNGDGVEYSYDDKGRLVTETYEDNDTVSYTYDNNGNLGTMKDSATGITTTYHYDLSNRLCKYTQTGEDYSRIVVYTYDSDNNLQKVSDTINGEEYTTSYAYNDDNVMTGKSHNYGFRLTQTFLDDFGRPSSVSGLTLDTASPIRDYTYYDSDSTSAGRVETFRQRSRNSEDASYDVTYTYTYDGNGNITSYNEGGLFTVYYTYDSANQLIKEDSPILGYTYTWTYDDAGNITSRTESGPMFGGTTRTVNYGYDEDNTGWGDLLTSYNGETIDSVLGNITDDGTWGYTWEHGRQLKSMSDGTTTWNYTYDADGLRIGRSNSTTTYSYLYGAEGLHSMTVGDETYIFRYDTLGNPLSMYNTATRAIYYYAVNLQGDVVGIITEDDERIVTYRYDAWGNQISISGSGKDTIGALNPLRYRGYVYDTETGLYYLQSRYYNPELGRFINTDNLAVLTATPMALTDKNLFAYCDNNPVIRADHGGDFWNVVIGAAVGAVVGVAGQFITDLATSALNGKWTFSNWQTYAGAAVGGAVGGAILGGTGNVGLANAASGFVTTGVGMSLEKVTGASDKSWAEIGVNAVADGAISYGLGKLPGVKNVTKGRNNMSAVYRSGLTKLRNKTVSHMSKNVIGKGLVSGFVGGLAMDGYYGVKQYGYNRIRNRILRYAG